MTYGPDVVTLIQGLVTKLEAGEVLTVADVEAQFAGLQPYSSYGVKKAGS